VAVDFGWVQSTGTFTIQNSWPAPYNVVGPGFTSSTSTATGATTMTDGGATWTVNQWKGHSVTAGGSTAFVVSNTATVLTIGVWVGGTPASVSAYTISLAYELFKVFRPESWLQAINWSLANSYPKRHVGVAFEVPQDYRARVIKWGELVKNLALLNPTVAPTVTEVVDGTGQYPAGTYTFGYTLYNDLGETLVSPTVSVVFAGPASRAQFSSIAGLPAPCLGVNYYSSLIPNDTTLGLLSIGTGVLPNNAPAGSLAGLNVNGIAAQITFPDPYIGSQSFTPIYNTTNVDVQELHHILKRINPGGFPEIWNDLGSDLYKPLGGKAIQLEYQPIGYFNLKFICTAVVPLMTKETDVTDEPPELIYAGAESFLWNLLVKTSTIVNTNWTDLAKQARTQYEELKSDYSLDTPRNIVYRPVIRVQY
jgi:hypothetical protein